MNTACGLTGHTATFNAPAQSLTGTLKSADTMTVDGFVRIANPADAGAPVASASVNMTLFIQTPVDGGPSTNFRPIGADRHRQHHQLGAHRR